MNSKEALCRISFELGKANGVDVNDSEYISIIEKDLEVLEILKKHFFEEYKIRSGANSLLFRINYTPEYGKVKE